MIVKNPPTSLRSSLLKDSTTNLGDLDNRGFASFYSGVFSQGVAYLIVLPFTDCLFQVALL